MVDVRGFAMPGCTDPVIKSVHIMTNSVKVAFHRTNQGLFSGSFPHQATER